MSPSAAHNPWSQHCGKRVDGEPFRDGERCPTCEPTRPDREALVNAIRHALIMAPATAWRDKADAAADAVIALYDAAAPAPTEGES